MVSTYIRQHHLGLVAIFIALTGTAYASNQITLHPPAHASKKKPRRGPQGPQGPQGGQGVQGPPGQDGTGSPDTPAQVLGKLVTVDGSGSGLDADLIDGLNSTAFLGANGTAANADKLDNLDSSAFVQSSPATFTDVGLQDPDNGGCPNAFTGWIDLVRNSAEQTARYWRDPFGLVHLAGGAQECNAPVPVALTLPAGDRPATTISIPMITAGGGDPDAVRIASVGSNGEIRPPSASNTASGRSVWLEGITFRCGPSGSNGCP